MPVKKCIAALCFFLLYNAFCTAQSTDYLVLCSGDTLRGQVDFLASAGSDEVYLKKIKLTNTEGRKRYKWQEVSAIRIGNATYLAFNLRRESSLPNPFREVYHIDPEAKQRYFLRVESQGQLNHYTLSWKEQGESTLMQMDLFQKEGDDHFVRATQGILGLKRKALANYLADCPQLIRLLQEKQLNQAQDVVTFFNNQCN